MKKEKNKRLVTVKVKTKATAAPGTPEIKVKSGILDKIKVDNTIKAKFSIQNLQMDRTLMWKLQLFVQKILPKSYHDYRVTLVFDEEPYMKQIADIEGQIMAMEKAGTLFKDLDKKEVNFQKERITATLDEKEKKKAECRTIEFVTEVLELKYNGGGTKLVIHVPDTAISDINDRKTWFSYYRLELKPLEISEPAVPDQSYKDEEEE